MEQDNNPIIPEADKPVFLYIPISRLIIMSILSCGLYEAYWIYKNWAYFKNRDNRYIKPFWRGWFGLFYCHSLLREMHSDKELQFDGIPKFSPGGLATGWVILILIANAVGKAPGTEASIVSFLIPSFLCFVPVQKHVNKINEQISPNISYTRWTKGHIVCLVIGLLLWSLMLLP